MRRHYSRYSRAVTAARPAIRLHLASATLASGLVELTEVGYAGNPYCVTKQEVSTVHGHHRKGQSIRRGAGEPGQLCDLELATPPLLRQYGDEHVGQLQVPSLAPSWPGGDGRGSASAQGGLHLSRHLVHLFVGAYTGASIAERCRSNSRSAALSVVLTRMLQKPRSQART